MEDIIISLKISSITIALMFSLLALRAPERPRAATYGILATFGGICYILQDMLPWSSFVWRSLLIINLAAVVPLWWFLQGLFDDDFVIGHRQRLIAGGWFVLIALTWAGLWPEQHPAHQLFYLATRAFVIGLMIYLMIRVFGGQKDDLIEQRRSQRLPLVIAMSVILITLAVSEFIWQPGVQNKPVWFRLIESGAIFAVAVICFFRLAKFNLELFKPIRKTVAKPDPKTNSLKSKLHLLMETGIYKDPDLSLHTVADQLAVRPHQLRKLINQSMGFDNFRHFLNSYRLAHVTRLLTEVSDQTMSITELAHEAGFNSIATFNRIFRIELGVSPTEYRIQNISKKN